MAFQDLMNGQLDAVIADNPLALGYIGQNPDKPKSGGPGLHRRELRHRGLQD